CNSLYNNIFMKNTILFCSLLLLCFLNLKAQVPDLPLSFTNEKVAKFKNRTVINYFPSLDKRLKKQPKNNSLVITSLGIDVNIDLLTIANKCKVKGGYVYIYKIKSLNAKKLRLFYKDFFLSEKAYLYVYSNNPYEIKRKLTCIDNQENSGQHSNQLFGNQIIIEHFEPKNSNTKSKLIIDMVAFGQ
ncbi:MAG: hypothetical protein AB8B69_21615, partial [Chitinophagales bacterium]